LIELIELLILPAIGGLFLAFFKMNRCLGRIEAEIKHLDEAVNKLN